MERNKKLSTCLEGRIKNLSLSPKQGIFAVYEAVVNGVQAIKNDTKGLIKIKIHRNEIQQSLINEIPKKGKIKEIEIWDNGIGLNQENMSMFLILDNTNKPELGCKGVGRLTWLKVFKHVHIKSLFQEDGKFYERTFEFDKKDEIRNEQVVEIKEPCTTGSIICLSDLEKEFEEIGGLQTEKLCSEILCHCLTFLLPAPNKVDINIEDGDYKKSLISFLSSLQQKEVKSDTFDVKGQTFTLTHVLLKGLDQAESQLAWCANGRIVLQDTKHLAGMSQVREALGKGKDKQTYICLIQSEYLDNSIDSSRTKFSISEEGDDLEGIDRPGFAEIVDHAKIYIFNFLKDLIEKAKEANSIRLEKCALNYPEFKPLINYFKEEIIIPEEADENRIKSILYHKQIQLMEQNHIDFERAKKECKNETLTPKQIEEKVTNLLTSLESKAINKTLLAHYVARRKVILDFLETTLRQQDNGQYEYEKVIHNLIVPMKCDSQNMYFDDANLWLIDDELAFHNYLASDLELKQYKITDLKSKDRPDITALKLVDFDGPMTVQGLNGEIDIVEFKRPMRKDLKDPIGQIISYAMQLTSGHITSYYGRPINIKSPIRAYLICDLTKSFEKKLLLYFNCKKIEDGFLYLLHDNLNLMINIFSYDFILQRAKKRNKVFFDKLFEGR